MNKAEQILQLHEAKLEPGVIYNLQGFNASPFFVEINGTVMTIEYDHKARDYYISHQGKTCKEKVKKAHKDFTDDVTSFLTKKGLI